MREEDRGPEQRSGERPHSSEAHFFYQTSSPKLIGNGGPYLLASAFSWP